MLAHLKISSEMVGGSSALNSAFTVYTVSTREEVKKMVRFRKI